MNLLFNIAYHICAIQAQNGREGLVGIGVWDAILAPCGWDRLTEHVSSFSKSMPCEIKEFSCPSTAVLQQG
jgi:hypothetical protein